jgi:steroid 5-alpha reductase family enzyme
MSGALTLSLGFLLCSGWMVAAWFFARAKNNYSLVDAAWAFLFLIVAIFDVVVSEGWPARNALLLLCVGAWSLRLGGFLAKRIYDHHPKEDVRYQDMRQAFGNEVETKFFWFFQYQAWSVLLLSAPFFILARNPNPEFSPLEWVGAVVFLISWLGESLADHQKKAFKQNPANRGKNCEIGLWRFSRHPNYFFESCIWWGFFALALPSPHGIWAIFCPALMLILLLKITGVAMSEKIGLRTYGEVYVNYQKRVSVFIPWFPKAAALVALCFLGLNVYSPAARAADAKSTADGKSEAKNEPALPSASPGAAGAIPDRVGKIYAGEVAKGDPLFIQKTHYDVAPDGRVTATSIITDQKGKPALKEIAMYEGAKFIAQNLEQYETGDHYEVMVKGNKVIFKDTPLKGDDAKGKTDDVDFTADFMMGPTTETFLASHWKELMDGQSVNSRFGVPEILDTIGIRFYLKKKETVNGHEVALIGMKPTSFFVGLKLDEIDLYLDTNTKRYVKYFGRTPLHTRDGDKLTPLDGVIIYE